MNGMVGKEIMKSWGKIWNRFQMFCISEWMKKTAYFRKMWEMLFSTGNLSNSRIRYGKYIQNKEVQKFG